MFEEPKAAPRTHLSESVVMYHSGDSFRLRVRIGWDRVGERRRGRRGDGGSIVHTIYPNPSIPNPTPKHRGALVQTLEPKPHPGELQLEAHSVRRRDVNPKP